MTKQHRKSPHEFQIKRIYDAPRADDGCRMLVDRLWPRGLTKVDARVDVWAKVAAPSTALRKWLHEDATRRDEFAIKYQIELNASRSEIEQLLKEIDQPTITLLTATKKPASGHVPTLQTFLESLTSHRRNSS